MHFIKITKINLELSGVQETLDHILTAIKETEQKCMKTKSTRYKKSKNCWENNKIRRLTNQKRKSFIQCERDKIDQSGALYKKLCKKVKKAALESCKKYEQKLALT